MVRTEVKISMKKKYSALPLLQIIKIIPKQIHIQLKKKKIKK